MRNRLFKIAERRKAQIKTDFVRYLYDDMDWSQALILIKGARGSGKTTLLLQHYKNNPEHAIYLSLDDFYFESNRLLLLIESLYEEGFRRFYLDEVHQYQYWSKDFKNLYDNYSDIQLIATGSSALQIDKGAADLSRRMTVYQLYGLSFREYVLFELGVNLPILSLEDLLENHQVYSHQISDQLDVLKYFESYLKKGYYPFYKTAGQQYHQKQQQALQLSLDVDLPAVETVKFATIKGMKNLLYVLSQMVPYTPNIQSLANKINITRNSVLKALDLMERTSILNLLRVENKGISYLQKPEKIYLENPNLYYVFAAKSPNKGSLRETFFFNQLKVRYVITASKFADFMVENRYTFEVGGASKTSEQIAGIPMAYIAADDIKYGSENKIPLWMFGLLY